jgi:hypothetical protein
VNSIVVGVSRLKIVPVEKDLEALAPQSQCNALRDIGVVAGVTDENALAQRKDAFEASHRGCSIRGVNCPVQLFFQQSGGTVGFDDLATAGPSALALPAASHPDSN